MKMADLKMTKAEKKDTAPCAVDNQPDYPYGLCIRLDSASLEKLGLKSLPKVGAKMAIQGVGVVTSVSAHESKNHDSRNVEIQLQELGVESAELVGRKERNELARADFNERLEAEKKRRA
jgi:hypothetical protein